MTDLTLSFAQLEAVLSSYFRIDPERSATFRARLKQLQRLNFPQGVNVGRGARFGYELEHCLKIILALEILGQGIPAKLATDLIEDGWERFQVAFQMVPWEYYDDPGSPQIYCLVNMDLIGDSYKSERSIEIYDSNFIKSKLLDEDSELHCTIFMNVSSTIRKFKNILPTIRIKSHSLAGEIRCWKTSLPKIVEDPFCDWVHVVYDRLDDFRSKEQ